MPLRGVAIVGIYATEQGRQLPHRTAPDLAQEACSGRLPTRGPRRATSTGLLPICQVPAGGNLVECGPDSVFIDMRVGCSFAPSSARRGRLVLMFAPSGRASDSTGVARGTTVGESAVP